MTHKFPAQLATAVCRDWRGIVGGDYTPPPLPHPRQLRTLLEVAYLAGMETDEGRHLRFALCCTPEIDTVPRHGQPRLVQAWSFAADRPLNVQEVRRLAPVTSADASAIWVRFPPAPDEPPVVHGLLNPGPSWATARNALAYHYETVPDALLVKAEAPGRLMVYQGGYLVASLHSGTLTGPPTLTPMGLLGIYPLFEEGSQLLRAEIPQPTYEGPRDWHEFEWLAYINTVLAVVNSVQLRGHGGAIIFARTDSRVMQDKQVSIKYRFPSADHLKNCFTAFMKLRHELGDMLWLDEAAHPDAPTESDIRLADYAAQAAERDLAQACDFVAGLSGADGAILLRTTLLVDGFGAEILLDRIPPSTVLRVTDPSAKAAEELDTEQFGMRHRSAMRLCSAAHDLAVFVVSQDGGVSLVWRRGNNTLFMPGLSTTNMNMILA